MKQLACVKCHTPLYDPSRDTCEDCARLTRALLVALRLRLKAELADEAAGEEQRGAE